MARLQNLTAARGLETRLMTDVIGRDTRRHLQADARISVLFTEFTPTDFFSFFTSPTHREELVKCNRRQLEVPGVF